MNTGHRVSYLANESNVGQKGQLSSDIKNVGNRLRLGTMSLVTGLVIWQKKRT